MTRTQVLVGIIGGLVVVLLLLNADWMDRKREAAIDKAIDELQCDGGVAVLIRHQGHDIYVGCEFEPGKNGQKRY